MVYFVTDKINFGANFTFQEKAIWTSNYKCTLIKPTTKSYDEAYLCEWNCQIIASCRINMLMSGWTGVLLIDVSSSNLSSNLFLMVLVDIGSEEFNPNI